MNKQKAKKMAWKLTADTLAGLINAGWPFQMPGYEKLTKPNVERVTNALLSVVGFCVRKSRGDC
jgi:hypothetical protein